MFTRALLCLMIVTMATMPSLANACALRCAASDAAPVPAMAGDHCPGTRQDGTSAPLLSMLVIPAAYLLVLRRRLAQSHRVESSDPLVSS
jgi:hypothetical protein